MKDEVTINYLDKKMAVMEERFDNLEKKLDDILKLMGDLPKTYATKSELEPLQRFVTIMQGAVYVIVMGLVGFVLAKVIPGFNL